jgi:hypothetical protein
MDYKYVTCRYVRDADMGEMRGPNPSMIYINVKEYYEN